MRDAENGNCKQGTGNWYVTMVTMLGKEKLRELLKAHGKKYSEELGINLKGGKSAEVFKWFVASVLFAARISEAIAIRTYKQFERDGLLEFRKAARASWDDYVKSLDEGGYVRYDFKTADKFLEIMKNFGERYGGDLDKLHEEAADEKDLERRVKELGKGIGDVTVNIFLREMRGVWKKANPEIGHLAKIAAKKYGIRDAKGFWTGNRIAGYDFVDFESMLTRIGLELRRAKSN